MVVRDLASTNNLDKSLSPTMQFGAGGAGSEQVQQVMRAEQPGKKSAGLVMVAL